MPIDIARLLLASTLCCASTTVLAADSDMNAPTDGATTQVTLAPGVKYPMPDARAMLVRNAPYSTDVVQERQQMLGDGNQILQRSTARAYRDSAGRSREETLDEQGEIRMASIKDPGAGVQWLVYPQLKTVTKVNLPPPAPTAFISGPPDGKAHVMERQTMADGSIKMLFKDEVVVDHVAPPVRGVVNIRPLPPGQAGFQPMSVLPQMSALVSGAFSDMKWAIQATRRDLGTRQMEGVKANGQVRSYEIPAGAVGNRNPIVVSNETWYAPDLRITLLSKHSDPRTGDAVFRIENLKRDEPSPSLFVPPADYTVNETKSAAQRLSDRKAE